MAGPEQSVTDQRETELLALLLRLAPGTVLREAIERVIGAGRGALLVAADTEGVRAVATGGFAIDATATAQRIAELAKMDGAILLAQDGSRILRANVHLVPDAGVHTSETGTRHRTAERVARQTGAPVISVSESMSRVTVYVGERRRVLEDVSTLLFRANQALSTLERYSARLDEVMRLLSTRELSDTATLRDVVVSLQRTEMVRRIAREVDDLVAELGSEGRLIELQRAELVSGVEEERVLLVRDYLADRRRKVHTVLQSLDGLDTDELLSLDELARLLAFDNPQTLDQAVVPRGHRQLARIPRLPSTVVDRLVQRFQHLPRIVAADLDELVEIDGIGDHRADSIHEGLARMVMNLGTDGPHGRPVAPPMEAPASPR